MEGGREGERNVYIDKRRDGEEKEREEGKRNLLL